MINDKKNNNINNNNIIVTIDVEDWFQVENFRKYYLFSNWSEYELRVERNTHQILDLLDECSNEREKILNKIDKIDKGKDNIYKKIAENIIKIRCTFFVLGWIAKKMPWLVREIYSRGHEIASHGYSHKLCYECSRNELIQDLIKSKKTLEDIIGKRILGYRAPSFSISDEILKTIEDSGYRYDSSYNSFGWNERYGKISISKMKKKGIAFEMNNKFIELPISNLAIYGGIIPWGGGGYFRIIPLKIFKFGVNYILKRENTYLFYCHPWEIDKDQPKAKSASVISKCRHYINIGKTKLKLQKLFNYLIEANFITCEEYIEKINKNDEL